MKYFIITTLATAIFVGGCSKKEECGAEGSPPSKGQESCLLSILPRKNVGSRKDGMEVHAWIYPGDPACSAREEISDGRKVHVLRAEYARLNEDGEFELRLEAPNFCNAYSAENAEHIKVNSNEALVTVSGHKEGVESLSEKKGAADKFINDSFEFVSDVGFDGIDIDFEGTPGWSEKAYSNFLIFLQKLTNRFHREGLKVAVDVPAIWNDRKFSQEETGEKYWLSHNSNQYNLKYEHFNGIGVDYFTIMVYDLMWDWGTGTANQPLGWLEDVVSWAHKEIDDKDSIVIGIPSYGYRGDGDEDKKWGDKSNLTFNQIKKVPGWQKASRDDISGELQFVDSDGWFYSYPDETTMFLRFEKLVELEVKRISIWHLGDGNSWIPES